MLECFTNLSSEFLEILFQIPPETLKIMHLFETYNCLANSSLKSGTVLRQRWFYQKRLPASPDPLSPEDMCSKDACLSFEKTSPLAEDHTGFRYRV